ncbi:hypothetical protein Bca52824_041579 [Brassica carinata]|uniref:Uncharacterized protein n=1 Tax=Brassica carinata TaxID=52824 RepID=A0A8X7RXL9_BRACI|nr:hypothetical protein Bca52824_041579 [Brassica carinata]
MATRQVRDDPPVHVKKNRRALWDIGNITSIPRVQGGKINHRPLTRNFRAKLLENAQAANKKTASSKTRDIDSVDKDNDLAALEVC